VDNFNLLQRIRAVVILFDVTDRKTFDQIMKWHRVAASTYDSHAFLVANKLDLAESREVSPQSAQLIADRYEMKYLELSAMTKKGVADLVAEITAAVNRED
jgi:50S ribosomal subunit-associated GTPase HflX